MDKSDIRFVLDLSLRQISLNSIFRPVIIVVVVVAAVIVTVVIFIVSHIVSIS